MAALNNLDLLKIIYDDLAEFLSEEATRGALSVAGSLASVLDHLTSGPNNFLVVILWEGEETASEDPYCGVVEHKFHFYVKAPVGLPARPGAHLFLADNPLLKRVSEVRDRIRSMRFAADETNRYINYRGTFPVVDSNGVPWDALELRFTLHAAIPEPTYRSVS